MRTDRNARPTALTPTDRARMRAAILRADKARAQERFREHLSAWGSVALISAVLVMLFRAV